MKRNNNVRRILIPLLIIFFVLIIVSAVLFLWYTFSGNYIEISNVDNKAYDATTANSADADIIITNGVVLGASKNTSWIGANNFYEANNNKQEFDVTLFSENKEFGTFKTARLKRYDGNVVYTTIAKESLPSKYIAVGGEVSKILPGMTKLEATKDDEKYVKDAIGSYKLVNGSVKVTEVYLTNINQTTDKIICATSKSANMLGVYSAVIYVTGNEAYLVKYSYVRDTDNADRWPIYSLQFVMDLNNDEKPEIVLEEITGNDVKYSVLELRDNNVFYEVLSAKVEI